MEKGKTGKYFKYAIGEIVLVVIGILIALSINTWNENRINKNLEQELLSNLLSDVEVDIENLKDLDSISELALIAKKKILSYIKGEELSRDSVFYFVSKSGYTNSFSATTITYDEMKNSDAFKIISSKEIRREIAVLYKQYEKVKASEDWYFIGHLTLRDIRIEDFSTGSLYQIGIGEISNLDQVIDQIKTNRQFKNALVSNYASTQHEVYKESLEKAKQFKNKLIMYLKND
ncbi:DUF6090 family protein [Flavobacteriaceae bacterium S0825]|uniref:DUF6090 family protein n=1 Tax=Gaetbulibacter sp. S0825 TaxID=2720084 RepID=UPI0014300D88|nr:DUF6090 family protein [Gaetbulibacter sp. S0825]MCK0109573.1 DUF6090 family protein [Flavobacteriaceae bacterium S0825]NIX65206.1 hypothetical protein [Gaetbulibacter sp. S0825]